MVNRREIYVESNPTRSEALAQTISPPDGYALVREGATRAGDKMYSDREPGIWTDLPDWEVGKYWLIARRVA